MKRRGSAKATAPQGESDLSDGDVWACLPSIVAYEVHYNEI